MSYPETVLLHINGRWKPAASGKTLPVLNPASEAVLGQLAHAGIADLDEALAAAEAGFAIWSRTSVFERYKLMRKAAELLRERADKIAGLMTSEQGKPLAEAKMETLSAADLIDWFAEEGRRSYGRVIPARFAGVAQIAVKEPVGPVAAFTPWNFPLSQSAKKVAAALAAGCSVILKGSEEAPFCCVQFVRAFIDAGVPAGVIQLLFGEPARISQILVPDPAIRKVSFTGSVPVGRMLAAIAGQHLKYATMELGGHAPALIFADAPLEDAVRSLVSSKYRNAGQVCVSPTRLLVESQAFPDFLRRFGELASALRVGDAFDPVSDMGPLVHERRLDVMEELVSDALQKGAKLVTGGKRIDRAGFFFEPTVLANVSPDARIMNEEPFGPIAIVNPFADEEDALLEANRLPYGLASYVYTVSAARIRRLCPALEAGMVSVNGQPIGLPEAPFGGVKDSGFGREGGIEGLDEYLVTKFVAERAW